MEIIIDRAKCVGHARCKVVAGDLYPLDEAGYISIDKLAVPEGQEVMAQRGAKACPERIITVLDDEGRQIWPVLRKKDD